MKRWARIEHVLDAYDMAGTPGPETFTLRVYGGGPKFLRFGRKILYRKSELNIWAAKRCFGSTSEYQARPQAK